MAQLVKAGCDFRFLKYTHTKKIQGWQHMPVTPAWGMGRVERPRDGWIPATHWSTRIASYLMRDCLKS